MTDRTDNEQVNGEDYIRCGVAAKRLGYESPDTLRKMLRENPKLLRTLIPYGTSETKYHRDDIQLLVDDPTGEKLRLAREGEGVKE